MLVFLNNTSINTIILKLISIAARPHMYMYTTYYNVNVYFNIVRELMEKETL